VENVIIYGNGPAAEIAYYSLTHDSSHTVWGFTVDREVIAKHECFGLPIVAFDEVGDCFPPAEHRMLVAIGYAQTNRLRAERCHQAREKGYSFVTYVSSRTVTAPDLVVGENCFIGANAVIQPSVRIGKNVTIRDQAFIGHDTVIEDHCFLAAGVTVAGKVTIEAYSLLGVNATVRDGIRLGQACVIGAGVTMLQDAQAKEVYMSRNAQKLPLSSDQI
jgi:sugar O-acyltransferase (sialic acid O-acetyltransferase NeuD family)